MKAINKFFSFAVVIAGAIFGMTSCSSETINYPSKNGLIDASSCQINVTVNQETNEWTATAVNGNGEAIRGARLIWTVYSKGADQKPTVSIAEAVGGQISKKGDYPIELQIANNSGISQTKAVSTIHIENNLGGDGFMGYKYDSQFNLWKNATLGVSTWVSPAGWSGGLEFGNFNVANDEITLSCPGDMGPDQWMGQLHISTNVPVIPGEAYDFCLYINPSKDADVTVKVQKDGDDNAFFTAEKEHFTAGGSFYHFANLTASFDGNLNLTLDFGGNAGVSFEIQNIVFKKHSDDDGISLPDTPNCKWVGANSDQNLWKGAKYTIETWTSGADWSGGVAEPVIENDAAKNIITATYNEAPGTDQWKAQFKLKSDLSLDASKSYDYRVTLGSTSTFFGATIKLTNGADDAFYVDPRVNLYANGDIQFGFADLTGKQLDDVMLVFDFGGAPAGTTITIKDIIVQEHQAK